jgi:hypothetical protein
METYVVDHQKSVRDEAVVDVCFIYETIFSCIFTQIISFKYFSSLASRRDTDAIVRYSFR